MERKRENETKRLLEDFEHSPTRFQPQNRHHAALPCYSVGADELRRTLSPVENSIDRVRVCAGTRDPIVRRALIRSKACCVCYESIHLRSEAD